MQCWSVLFKLRREQYQKLAEGETVFVHVFIHVTTKESQEWIWFRKECFVYIIWRDCWRWLRYYGWQNSYRLVDCLHVFVVVITTSSRLSKRNARIGFVLRDTEQDYKGLQNQSTNWSTTHRPVNKVRGRKDSILVLCMGHGMRSAK